MTWFEKFPHRLHDELEALNAVGVLAEIDNGLENKGIIRLEFTIPADNEFFDLPENTPDLNLIVVFPDSYPYFRPNVYAKDLNLSRHQDPIEKNLCLLPRPTGNWLPETFLADLLKTQLKKVLHKGIVTDFEVIKADDSEQAEPISEYYTFGNPTVLFDTSILKNGAYDDFDLLGNITIGLPKDSKFPSRMAVLNLVKEDVTFVIPSIIRAAFGNKIDGLIFYSPETPPQDPGIALKWLKEKLTERKQSIRFPGKPIRLKDATIMNVIGFVFKEEMKKGEYGLTTIFLIESLVKIIGPDGKIQKKLPGRPRNYYSKAAPTIGGEHISRVPQLRSLMNKKVAIVGLGALGGFLAIELARNKIQELRVMDFDEVDPTTSMRWPLGLFFAGAKKVDAIAQFIASNFPDTECKPIQWRLGNYQVNAKEERPVTNTEETILNEFLENVSLVIDATAEVGVHHFLSKIAQEKNIPYMSISATPGAYGGLVMRVVPDKTQGCWMCMKYWQDKNAEMVPRSNESGGMVQPPGCGDITFTGAGFDLQNIVLAGVRLAVSTLCLQDNEGYPDVNWDIGVLNLFDEYGFPIVPNWKTFELVRHPECPYHEQ
jgi:molybdopterin/thiamine biosynthesis adenylyltransferase